MLLEFLILIVLSAAASAETLAELEANMVCSSICQPMKNPVAIKYYLYTRLNPNVPNVIMPNNLNSIKKSNFNSSNPTRIITHGWNNDVTSDINKALVPAYLAKGDFNAIFVDWGSCAKAINYVAARCCIVNVGQQIAKFIDFMNEKFQMKFDNLALTGHSLGAHVVGLAGKNVRNGKINTIVGLDPARPCFEEDLAKERLAITDAKYVETMHTNGDGLGFMIPIGHASFYPNWGKIQNGCKSDFIPENPCSHSMSYNFYAESITNNKFAATKCGSYEDLLNKRNCSQKTNVKMGGEPSNEKISLNGIFYLATNADPPYGKG